MNTNDIFWINDPKVLFCNGNYYKIIPTKNMTKNEVLNALTRLFIYIMLVCVVISNIKQCFYIPIIAIIVIIVIYYASNNKSSHHKQQSIEKITPSKNNPYMNPTMANLYDNPNDLADEKFYENFMADNDDIFGRKHDTRSFYTMPSTTIPNDQEAFAKWLYQLPETCKENTSKCLSYDDIRFSR